MKQMKTGLLFLYGVGLNSSVWSEMAKSLPMESLFPDYPGRDGDPGQTGKLTFTDYVDSILSQVRNWEADRIIIVAHSISGVLGFEIASRLKEKVIGFIGVGAAITEKGGSFLSVQPVFARYLNSLFLMMGQTRPPNSIIQSTLCNGLSSDTTARVLREFIPESANIYRHRIFAEIPEGFRAYIRLLQDKQMSLKVQDQMVLRLKAHNVFDLNTGHLPMLADPAGLAGIIRTIVKDIN